MLVALALSALLLVLLAAATVSRRPAVAPGASPTAAEMRAGQRILADFARARRAGAGRLDADAAGVAAVAALVRPRTGLERLRLRLAPDRVVASGSEEIVAGWWVNFSVAALAESSGPPPIEMSVGRLDVPRWAAPAVLDLLRLGLRLRGVRLPALEESVESLSIARGRLVAELRFPASGDASLALGGPGAARLDRQLVLQTYCRLVAEQKARPDPSFEVQVRRAFADDPLAGPAESNRAAFIALGMFVSRPRLGEQAGLSRREIESCRRRSPTITLLGRDDLAAHWALSAALAALYGEGAAASAGEWKELADTGPGGSGFSFLDLAADRSGIVAARLAADPERADAMRRRLARIDDPQLLPPQLRSLPERMSEAELLQRYGGVGSPAYRQQLRRIDAVLDRAWPG